MHRDFSPRVRAAERPASGWGGCAWRVSAGQRLTHAGPEIARDREASAPAGGRAPGLQLPAGDLLRRSSWTRGCRTAPGGRSAPRSGLGIRGTGGGDPRVTHPSSGGDRLAPRGAFLRLALPLPPPAPLSLPPAAGFLRAPYLPQNSPGPRRCLAVRFPRAACGVRDGGVRAEGTEMGKRRLSGPARPWPPRAVPLPPITRALRRPSSSGEELPSVPALDPGHTPGAALQWGTTLDFSLTLMTLTEDIGLFWAAVSSLLNRGLGPGALRGRGRR